MWEWFKAVPEKVQIVFRKHFFTERVVKHRNRLPSCVVDAPFLSVFKRHLDNPLKTCFNFWSAVGLYDHGRTLPTEIFSPTLLCPVLLCSILNFFVSDRRGREDQGTRSEIRSQEESVI